MRGAWDFSKEDVQGVVEEVTVQIGSAAINMHMGMDCVS